MTIECSKCSIFYYLSEAERKINYGDDANGRKQ